MNTTYFVITGATGGLGSEITRLLSAVGVRMCLIGRDKNKLKELFMSLPASDSGSHKLLECDLTDLRQVASVVMNNKDVFDFSHTLINCAAAHGPIGPIEEQDISAWEATVRLNYLTPVFLSRAVISGMKSRKFGNILNISGGGATAPRPFFSCYASTKTALVRFTETIAAELLPFGITANSIAPGPMNTSMLHEVINNAKDYVTASEYEMALRVINESESTSFSAANLVLFLCVGAGRGITGKLISAVWDNWQEWPKHAKDLVESDVYTLRRIAGRDRGFDWGDN